MNSQTAAVRCVVISVIIVVVGVLLFQMDKQMDKVFLTELIKLEGDVIRNRDAFNHADEQITYQEQQDIYDRNTMALSEARGQYRVYLRNACYKLSLRDSVAFKMKRDMELYDYCKDMVGVIK